MTSLACRPLPPLEFLDELFEIDETSPSGLRRIKTVGSRARKGEIAGTKQLRGYWRVQVRYEGEIIKCLAHRLVYAMSTRRNIDGVLIDHIDGVNKQNILSNLREASHSENMRNRAKSKTKCTSKYLGVYLCSRSNKWRVGIKSNQEKIDLGRYESEEEAAMVYNRAALARHKEFASLNLIASEPVLGLPC